MLDDEPNSLAALNLDFLADQLSATLDAAAAGLPVLHGSATRLLAAQVVTYTELVTVWSANPNPRPNPNPNPKPTPDQVGVEPGCALLLDGRTRWRPAEPCAAQAFST